MAARFLLVSLFLSLLVACDKKEDDPNPGKDYTGLLSLSYSRTFPTFQSNVDINLEISQNGEVKLVDPNTVLFDGLSEKMISGERTKIREKGEISITTLSGDCINMGGKSYLRVNLSCLIEGVQTVWSYEGFQWTQKSETPFAVENPVETPMLFRIENAEMSEAVCGANCSDCWGNTCFRWRLVLTPKN